MASVSWLEVKVQATTEAVDWVHTALAGMLPEISLHITPYPTPDPWDCQLSLCWSDDLAGRSQLAAFLQKLSPLERSGLIAAPDITPSAHPSEHPAVTVQHLGQFAIIPTGMDYLVQTHEQPIWLRPSPSFGSGYHPATILSLRLIERFVRPQHQVLDLGTGSGILSLACARLGAKVLALDNDPVAIQACRIAIQDNGLKDSITAEIGSLGAGNQFGHWLGDDYGPAESGNPLPPPHTPPAQFDLIVANLLARLHLALAPDYVANLRATHPQGVLITAGFTQDYQPTVEQSFQDAGLQLLAQESSQEWVALAHTVACSAMSSFPPLLKESDEPIY
jgi:ribosomal protein L11 methyltransferase